MEPTKRFFPGWGKHVTLTRALLAAFCMLLGQMFVCGPLGILYKHPRDTAAAKEIAASLQQAFPDAEFDGSASYERPRIYIRQMAGKQLERGEIEVALKSICEKRMPGYVVCLRLSGESDLTEIR